MSNIQFTSITLPGTLASPGFNINIRDVNLNTFSQWTGGGSLVIPFDEQPPLGEQWSLLGWSISYVGLVEYNNNAILQKAYGKLGALWGGPLVRSAVPLTPVQVTYNHNPIPPDQNVGKIWDPTNDPLFAGTTVGVYSGLPSLQGRSFSQQLPQTINMASGDSLAFGLWLTPSLITNCGVDIANAQVSLTYEASPHLINPR